MKQMKLHGIYSISVTISTALLCTSCAKAQAQSRVTGQTQPASASSVTGSRPNVVFILADNVGYGDLGPCGGG